LSDLKDAESMTRELMDLFPEEAEGVEKFLASKTVPTVNTGSPMSSTCTASDSSEMFTPLCIAHSGGSFCASSSSSSVVVAVVVVVVVVVAAVAAVAVAVAVAAAAAAAAQALAELNRWRLLARLHLLLPPN
jgi:hypothetical protein